MPTNPDYEAKANAFPTGDYVPPFAMQLGPPGATPAQVAVPMMGVHWVDARSAELQRLPWKPEAYRPFSRTFISRSAIDASRRPSRWEWAEPLGMEAASRLSGRLSGLGVLSMGLA